MRLAIQTLLLPGRDLVEQFDNAARYGFDGVEIAVGPTFDLTMHLSDVQQAMKSSGLPVSDICTHPMHDPIVPDPVERTKRLQLLKELLSQADHLGASGVVSVPVRPPHQFPDLSPWKDGYALMHDFAVTTLTEWAATLPAGTAALFLEPLNRYEAAFLNRVGQAVALAQAIDNPRVQVLADFFHMNIEEADMGAALLAAGDRLGMVHVADNNRLQPGRGCLDFRPGFAALKALDYQGFISIECWSPQGPVIEGPPESALPETVRFLRSEWADA